MTTTTRGTDTTQRGTPPTRTGTGMPPAPTTHSDGARHDMTEHLHPLSQYTEATTDEESDTTTIQRRKRRSAADDGHTDGTTTHAQAQETPHTLDIPDDPIARLRRTTDQITRSHKPSTEHMTAQHNTDPQPITPTTRSHNTLHTTTTTIPTATGQHTTRRHHETAGTTHSHDDATPDDQPHEWTWQGQVLGTHTCGLLDYIATHERTARRATAGAARGWLSTPTDHKAIGQNFDLNTDKWNDTARMTRAKCKPIGWTLDETQRQAWGEAIRQGESAWTPSWTVYDINAFAQALVQYGTAARRRQHGRSRRRKTQEGSAADRHTTTKRVHGYSTTSGTNEDESSANGRCRNSHRYCSTSRPADGERRTCST